MCSGFAYIAYYFKVTCVHKYYNVKNLYNKDLIDLQQHFNLKMSF